MKLPLRPTAPSTTQWSPNRDPPPVSRKLQHGATTSVERSSTIQASTPQAFSAQQRLEPLQMAPDFRHPSTHPLFFLDCAAASLCCFCFHIYLLFCNPFRDRRRRQSLSISSTLPHFLLSTIGTQSLPVVFVSSSSISASSSVSSAVTGIMSGSRPLRGGCQCGRNRYIIAIPEDRVKEAQVLFNTEPQHRK